MPLSEKLSEDVRAGLVALVMAGGSARRAEQAIGVKASTIRSWRTRYADEYAHLRREYGARLEAAVISEQLDFMVRAEQVKRAALDKTAELLESGQLRGRDVPAALRDVTKAQQTAAAVMLQLSGRPTHVVEHRSAAELVARLAALGAVVDSTAVEMEAARDGAPALAGETLADATAQDFDERG